MLIIYIFVLFTLNLLSAPLFANNTVNSKQELYSPKQRRTRKPLGGPTHYTPETYLAHLIEKEDDLFWKIIRMSCPARHINCYFFESKIKLDLKDITEALAKKPKNPAPRSHEISPYICSEVDKELEKNNIHPDNVSLVADDLKENIIACTSFIPHASGIHQAIITFDKKLFIALAKPKKFGKNTRIISTIAHEVAHIQYLHPIKQAYIQKSKESVKNRSLRNHVKKKELEIAEKAFAGQNEIMATLGPALQEEAIAQAISKSLSCDFSYEIYDIITKSNKFQEDGIHPSRAYTCHKIKKIMAMYKKSSINRINNRPKK